MAYIAAIHKQRGSQGAVLDPFGDVGRRPVSGASAYSRPSVGEEESKRKKFTDVSGVFFSPFSFPLHSITSMLIIARHLREDASLVPTKVGTVRQLLA